MYIFATICIYIYIYICFFVSRSFVLNTIHIKVKLYPSTPDEVKQEHPNLYELAYGSLDPTPENKPVPYPFDARVLEMLKCKLPCRNTHNAIRVDPVTTTSRYQPFRGCSFNTSGQLSIADGGTKKPALHPHPQDARVPAPPRSWPSDGEGHPRSLLGPERPELAIADGAAADGAEQSAADGAEQSAPHADGAEKSATHADGALKSAAQADAEKSARELGEHMMKILGGTHADKATNVKKRKLATPQAASPTGLKKAKTHTKTGAGPKKPTKKAAIGTDSKSKVAWPFPGVPKSHKEPMTFKAFRIYTDLKNSSWRVKKIGERRDVGCSWKTDPEAGWSKVLRTIKAV